jgi:gliding motility-associated-like protein
VYTTAGANFGGPCITFPYNAAGILRVGNTATAPFGTMWTAPVTSVVNPTSWTLANLGETFGTAIDGSGNVYFASTVIYSSGPAMGINYPIIPPTNPNLGDSVLIVKASGAGLNTLTSHVRINNSLPGVALNTNVVINNGWGAGNLCIDDTKGKMYFTNLDDGRIYCADLASGNIVDTLDPFTADASSGSIAPNGEILFGIAINVEPNGKTRVYFSRHLTNLDNEIWSVETNAAGLFVRPTIALEVIEPVNTTQDGEHVITDIEFSKDGIMIYGEKGSSSAINNNSHKARVFQKFGQSGAWTLGGRVVNGTHTGNANCGGGLDFGRTMTQNGQMTCDSLIWATANYMNGNMYGVHSVPTKNKFVGSTTFATDCHVVDYDGTTTIQATCTKGKFGDFEFFDSCTNALAKDPCKDLNVFYSIDSNCCVSIELQNNFYPGFISTVRVHSPVNPIASSSPSLPFTITNIDANTVDIQSHTSLPTGTYSFATICLNATSNSDMYVYYIGNAPQYDTVCVDTIKTQCIKVPKSNCVALENDSIVCHNGTYDYYVQLRNFSADTIRGVTVFNTIATVDAVSSQNNGGEPFFGIPDLYPGATSAWIQIPLIITGSPAPTQACFYYGVCDVNIAPGTYVGGFPIMSKFCCTDTTRYCVPLDPCGPGGPGGGCNGAMQLQVQPDSNACCATVTIINNWPSGMLQYVDLTAASGTTMQSVSGWSVGVPASSSYKRINAPGGGVSAGTYANALQICVGGDSPNHEIYVDYVMSDTSILCRDTIRFDNCIPPPNKCGVIVRDSMYCENGKTMYTFSVQNNGAWPIAEMYINADAPGKFVINPATIVPNPPIAIGSTAGPYTAEVDTANGGDTDICFYVTAYDAIHSPTSSPKNCCTDAKNKVCYPFVNCKIDGCCEFDKMTIPNGITPNGDGKNDKWVIIAPALCDSINIVVMNRWGNKVYEDKNYLNNWGGTNQAGALLPQGTYFVVITLPSGSQKGMYIDIRY